jgi:DNA modification methylase
VIEIQQGDARKLPWPDGFFHAVITSPPYFGLRKYGSGPNEIGTEPTPDAYVASLVEVGREVRRVLRDDGSWWLNIGDSYANDEKWGGASGNKQTKELHGNSGSGNRAKRTTGVAPKNLFLIPARVALALQAEGWIVRAEVPWMKANAMPSPVQDRPNVAHETIYLLAKSPRYFFDLDAVRREYADERGGNPGGKGVSERNVGGRSDGFTSIGSGWRQTASGRSLRTTDFYQESLDMLRRDLARLDAEGGMLVSPEGDPLALDIPTMASSLEHFAMWPPRLVAEMVKASTSERGACAACGAPWARVVERTKTVRRPSDREPELRAACVEERTVGWKASCACPPGEPVPCRVLDPFGGAGTTAAVAEALGRDGYHVELNPEYLTLPDARRREVRAALLGESTGQKVSEKQTSLFDIAGGTPR